MNIATSGFSVSRTSPAKCIRCLFLLMLVFLCRTATAAEPVLTGSVEPKLTALDELLVRFTSEHKIPGAALAVTYQGRLVYARGCGFADVERQEPVQPTSLFRIASISKPITAVALLQLVELGKLKLEDSILDRLPEDLLKLTSEQKATHPWRGITIQHCLQHTGGWDRDASFDPMFHSLQIAKSFGVAPPAGPTEIIRHMAQQPLDFPTGERYAYSNFGYCVLGRIIEQASGQAYGAFVQEHLWKKLGTKGPRLGRTLLKHRAPNEVRYYEDEPLRRSVFAENLDEKVPTPYGAWNLEAMDAHGGWICSAVDLAKFAAAFDHPEQSVLLRPETIKLMFSTGVEVSSGKPKDDKSGSPQPEVKPQPTTEKPATVTEPQRIRRSHVYYGLGWTVRESAQEGKLNTWHNGSLSGTATVLVRRYDGIDWAILLNTRRVDPAKLVHQADVEVNAVLSKIQAWPDTDLFPQFSSSPD